MVVHMLDQIPGHIGAVGLHVGAENVQQHFQSGWAHVELELDHLLITCPLKPSFWRDAPEIHDVRLSSWLESKRSSGKIPAQTTTVAMVPTGGSSFRIQMITEGQTARQPAEGEGVAFVSQIESPLASFDRRQRNIGHVPDRRKNPQGKIGKLKGNASS